MSNVVGRRGVPSTQVTLDEVVDGLLKPKALPELSIRNLFHRGPKTWPRELTGILKPEKDWMSPTAAGYESSVGTWVWARTYCQRYVDNDGVKLEDARPTCLVRVAELCTYGGDTFLALIVTEWACVGWATELVSLGYRKLRFDRGAIRWHHILNVEDASTAPFEFEYVQGHGLLFKELGEQRPLLKAALLTGERLGRPLLQFLCRTLDPSQRLTGSNAALLSALIDKAFPEGDPERQQSIDAAVEQPKQKTNDDDLQDDVLADVLEEVAVHDPI